MPGSIPQRGDEFPDLPRHALVLEAVDAVPAGGTDDPSVHGGVDKLLMRFDPVLLMRLEFAFLSFDVPYGRVDELDRRLRRKRLAVDQIARRGLVQLLAVGIGIAAVFAVELLIDPHFFFGKQLFQARPEIVAAPAREPHQLIIERLQPPVPEPAERARRPRRSAGSAEAAPSYHSPFFTPFYSFRIAGISSPST